MWHCIVVWVVPDILNVGNHAPNNVITSHMPGNLNYTTVNTCTHLTLLTTWPQSCSDGLVFFCIIRFDTKLSTPLLDYYLHFNSPCIYMTPTDTLLQQHTMTFPDIKHASFCLAYCLNYPEDGGNRLLWNDVLLFKSTKIHIAQDWELHVHQ